MIDTFVPTTNLAQPRISINVFEGDPEAALETMFRAHSLAMCRYANGILNDQDEAKEMVQQVFIELWEKRNQIEIRVSLRSYLYRSVHNRCLNAIKAKKKFNHDIEMHDLKMYSASSDAALKYRELKEKTERAISSLPPQCERIFRMSREEHLKYAEIAQLLELSVKTVENQMGKALKQLRAALQDYLILVLIFLNL